MKLTRSFTAFAVAVLATTTLTISSAASQDQGSRTAQLSWASAELALSSLPLTSMVRSEPVGRWQASAARAAFIPTGQ